MSYLTVQEGVPLGYALVDYVARSEGVRALAIKGPVLAEQGLRDERTSVDVDLLVDPERFDQMRAAVLRLGWIDAEPYELPSVLPRHSVTLRHEIWPNELDLHHYFPGFLADPQVVFERLWRDRAHVELAKCEIACPSPEAHAMIAALHYLREAKLDTAQKKLAALAERLRAWPPERLQRLVDLSSGTGSTKTLQPLFDMLDVQAGDQVTPPGFAEWQLKAQSETTAALAWWLDVKTAPWWAKLQRLKRAAWPSKADMMLFASDLPTDKEGLRRVRIARLRRGLRQLPQAVRETHRHHARRRFQR